MIFLDDDIQYKLDSIHLRSVASDNELCFKDNCDIRLSVNRVTSCFGLSP